MKRCKHENTSADGMSNRLDYRGALTPHLGLASAKLSDVSIGLVSYISIGTPALIGLGSEGLVEGRGKREGGIEGVGGIKEGREGKS